MPAEHPDCATGSQAVTARHSPEKDGPESAAQTSPAEQAGWLAVHNGTHL